MEPRRETDRLLLLALGRIRAGGVPEVLDKFTADTGIETKYESARDFLPVIRTRLAAGNPPDVAIIPRPGVVAELARDDALIPLEDMGLDPDAINENYSDTWTSLATVDDTVYGVVAKANSKSTIWYKPNSFQQAGFEIPATWKTSATITAQYESQGKTPWAVGAQGRDNLCDPDRLVREHLRPQGRFRQLHEALQR